MLAKLDRSKWTSYGVEVIDALAKIGNQQAIDALIDLAGSQQKDMRYYALSTMKDMDTPRVREFLETLPEEDSQI